MTSSGTSWKELAARLADELPGSSVLTEEPIGALTTYRVGGSARVLAEIGTSEDLKKLALLTSSLPDLRCLIIGRGSNLLVSDSGFNGLALRLSHRFAESSFAGTQAAAGAAMTMPALARQCASEGLGGLSWAVGVPGSVGGAICMNAGGHGSDVAEVLLAASGVNLTTGEEFELSNSELKMGYRRSAVGEHLIVSKGRFQLEESDPETETKILEEILKWRRLNQPGGSNSGSVFKNPDGAAAGHLIEAAECKGMRVGSAVVSRKHANFIITDRGGSAQDVLNLMCKVASTVKKRLNVELSPETRLAGFEFEWNEYRKKTK